MESKVFTEHVATCRICHQPADGMENGVCQPCRLTRVAMVKVSPESDQGTVALVCEVGGLLKHAQSRVIAGDTDVKLATDDLVLVAKVKKAIEERRKEYVGPINDHLKAINEWFKTSLTGPLDEADRLTRSKVLTYRQEAERRAKEAEEINRLRIEAAKREAALSQTGEIFESVGLIDVPAGPPAHIRTETGTLGTTPVRKWELVDMALVPDEYKIVDAVKIGRVVRAGVDKIAGIRIWIEQTLRLGTK